MQLHVQGPTTRVRLSFPFCSWCMLILLAIGTPQVNNLLSIWAFYRYLYDTACCQLLGDQDVATTGRRIVLPASFPGGVRHMQHSYQNSMAIVRTLGKPGYFITFTANPNWEEIQAELLTDDQGDKMQSTRDRPALVARVFKMKHDDLIRDLKSNKVLGEYVAHVSVIKRALPHPPLGQEPPPI